MNPFALLGAAVGIIKDNNVGKIFSSGLGMDVRFFNRSDETLTLAHCFMAQCVVTKAEPAVCKTLESQESCLVRVKKESGLLDGAYGPEVHHLWITEDGDWIGYIVQNPINGSPEGSFECYSSETKDKTKVYMSLKGK